VPWHDVAQLRVAAFQPAAVPVTSFTPFMWVAAFALVAV
jgi:hypothetical protein